MKRIKDLLKVSSLLYKTASITTKAASQRDVATIVDKIVSTSIRADISTSLAFTTTRWSHSFASQSFPKHPIAVAKRILSDLRPAISKITQLSTRHLATIASSSSSTTVHQAIAVGPAVFTAGISPGLRKALAWWLGGCSAWVFSMVVLGGITRLTRSGLSMTDWKFTGETPPSNPEEWQTEFDRYKLSPEYKRVNISMTLEEFKFIYWMEWAHRMWGRGLGIFFAVPAAWFAMQGAITRPLAGRLGLLFVMGASQGFVGWWMVKSGLEEPEDSTSVPRVSPYRLAAHLTSAFAIYAVLAWTTMSVAVPSPPSTTVGQAGARAAAALRAVALPASVLLAVTAVSGAFVAGLDAGHAYNTFPDMNGQLIPDEYWSRNDWRNFFESTAAVQLHHRALALTTLATVFTMWRYGSGMEALPRSSRLLLHGLMAGASGQVGLGIATLLLHVPVELGSAHQAGALALFTLMLGLLYSVRPVPTLSPMWAMWAKYGTGAVAAVAVGIGGAVATSS